MTIAVDRPKAKDGTQSADFIGLVAWERTAEFSEKYLSKGQRILVEGRITTGIYEKDGVKKYTTDVVCDRIEFADSKSNGGAANGDASSGAAPDPNGEVGDDDIPF